MISNDTIVAPATPYGVGGISIVRLSGPESKHIALTLSGGGDIVANCAVFSSLYDKNNASFEQAVITYFKSPNSYTGEDIVEISCHGNPLLVQKIVDLCLSCGSRLADPGEFTLRAFANGKMDLLQAESVSGLIHSQSYDAATLNFHVLRGRLSEKFNLVQKAIITLLSAVEYYIDISEEETPKQDVLSMLSQFDPIIEELQSLLTSYNTGRLLTEGAQVVLIGEPNVGKSTLLNALSNSDRAITSPTPGTTRDSVDVRVVLGGIPVRFVDTAGLRAANSKIEQEGVRRTLDALTKADLVLYIISPDVKTDSGILSSINVRYLLLHNKSDLRSAPPETDKHLEISAKTGAGIPDLRKQITESLSVTSAAKQLALTTARQYNAAKDCFDSLRTAKSFISADAFEAELCSFELRNALTALSSILGKTTPDDILNNIFDHFCVGK